MTRTPFLDGQLYIHTREMYSSYSFSTSALKRRFYKLSLTAMRNGRFISALVS